MTHSPKDIYKIVHQKYTKLKNKEDYNKAFNLDINYEIAYLKHNLQIVNTNKDFNQTLGNIITMQYIQKTIQIKRTYLSIFSSLLNYSVASLFDIDHMNNDRAEEQIAKLKFQPTQMHHLQALIRYEKIEDVSNQLGDESINVDNIIDESQLDLDNVDINQIKIDSQIIMKDPNIKDDVKISIRWFILMAKQVKKIQTITNQKYQNDMQAIHQPCYVDEQLNIIN